MAKYNGDNSIMANRTLKYQATSADNYTGTQGVTDTEIDQRRYSNGNTTYGIGQGTIIKYADGVKVAESGSIGLYPENYDAFWDFPNCSRTIGGSIP